MTAHTFDTAFHAVPRSEAAQAAFRTFSALGLPNRRVEAWHYTDLARALSVPAPFSASPHPVNIEHEERLATTRLVLVDGYFVPTLSDPLPEGCRLDLSLPEPGEIQDAMLAFAAAFAQGGFTLEVTGDIGAIEIVHIGQAGHASASHLRFLVHPQARVQVLERSVGAGQAHRLTTWDLRESAHVEHVAVLEAAVDVGVETLCVQMQRAASFSSFGLICAGKLVRRQIFAQLLGEDASIHLSGLSLINQHNHTDVTLEVAHKAPCGVSREFFRHIILEEGTGIFQGKVIVAPHAQKTDGGMKSQALLLSPQAQMHNKPELEIFADDVVCGHGATVGALDPELVFYAQARGIPRTEAEAMLLEAFGIEAIERVSHEGWRYILTERLWLWLRGRAL